MGHSSDRDHGSTRTAELSGARIIEPDILQPIAGRSVLMTTRTGFIRLMRPAQVWLETRELRANGYAP